MRTLILLGLIVIPATAQDDGWKTEIDNNLVRVSRRLVAPHGTVSTAETPPALLVFLTDYSVRVTGAGRQGEVEGKRGGVLWHPGGRIGIENSSGQRLDVAQVAPKYRPEPSYELPAAKPANVKFENDRIRVRPGRIAAGTRLESRRGPMVVFHLSPAHIRFTRTDGPVDELRVNAGQIRFHAGGSWIYENLGDDYEVIRIDLRTSKPDRE